MDRYWRPCVLRWTMVSHKRFIISLHRFDCNGLSLVDHDRVAACIAMSEITELIVNYNEHLLIGDNHDYYHILASKASYVYITSLWNGRFVNLCQRLLSLLEGEVDLIHRLICESVDYST